MILFDATNVNETNDNDSMASKNAIAWWFDECGWTADIEGEWEGWWIAEEEGDGVADACAAIL